MFVTHEPWCFLHPHLSVIVSFISIAWFLLFLTSQKCILSLLGPPLFDFEDFSIVFFFFFGGVGQWKSSDSTQVKRRHLNKSIASFNTVSYLLHRAYLLHLKCFFRLAIPLLSIKNCHFDLTENLNECEKNLNNTEKNLNLTIKIALLHRNLYQIQSKKNLNFVWVIWISLHFRKKIWMI